MTQAASFYKLVRPKMVEENIIKIKGGRWVDAFVIYLDFSLTHCSHILQELTVPSYVPNDTFIVGEESDSVAPDSEEPGDQSEEPGHGPSMLLLTGPNYSGKSVYMKQVS